MEYRFCSFTPLESPDACSGDEDKIPFGANTGFKAPCEPSRRKVEDLLTGFTGFPGIPEVFEKFGIRFKENRRLSLKKFFVSLESP